MQVGLAHPWHPPLQQMFPDGHWELVVHDEHEWLLHCAPPEQSALEQQVPR